MVGRSQLVPGEEDRTRLAGACGALTAPSVIFNSVAQRDALGSRGQMGRPATLAFGRMDVCQHRLPCHVHGLSACGGIPSRTPGGGRVAAGPACRVQAPWWSLVQKHLLIRVFITLPWFSLC